MGDDKATWFKSYKVSGLAGVPSSTKTTCDPGPFPHSPPRARKKRPPWPRSETEDHAAHSRPQALYDACVTGDAAAVSRLLPVGGTRLNLSGPRFQAPMNIHTRLT